MIDIFSKLYDSFSDSTKRFEDRVLQATMLLGECHSQWFIALSKALYPLLAHGDVPRAYETYTSFLYEQAKYQLPAKKAVAIIYEAETRMKDNKVQAAMARIRLGTFLIFRWLDTPNSDGYICSYCYSTAKQYRFGSQIQGTWALLKNGSEFIINSAEPLEKFLNSKRRIEFSKGSTESVEDVCLFLKNQMDALNTLIGDMATDIGIIHARSDFLRGIDLRTEARTPISLDQLIMLDDREAPIYRLIAEAERIWNMGLLSERQEELTLGLKAKS